MARFFRRKQVAPDQPEQTPGQTPPVAVPEAPVADAKGVEEAVERTRRSWFSRIGGIFQRGELDEQLWEELEETLIGADTGVETTMRILDRLRERVRKEGIRDAAAAQEALKQELIAILDLGPPKGKLWDGAAPATPPHPAIILVVGVNGTGKTTSIGKLAHGYVRQGNRVLLAAGDTFRAAAIDQLKHWGERIGADVVAHQQGADPGAVVFDALTAAEKRDADILIIDTAGRLHTKANLMDELSKVNRIIQRKDESAPHEVLLVIDATTGQNALPQAKYFTEAVGVTAILLSKLDGTARGGVIFAVTDQLGIPVRFVGTGEAPQDLAPFDAERFVEALLA